jgi:hypothetical protein
MSTTPMNKPNTIPAAIAAIRTLEHLGYTYTEGAELWRPPLEGKMKSLEQFPIGMMSQMGMRAMSGDFWIYHGDGNDHLKSLTCPVIIDPRRLQNLIECSSSYRDALQRIGTALGLLAGTDITIAVVPAIEALKAENAKGCALYDSAYVAGLGAGYNFGVTEDNAGLQCSIEARSGYLKVLKEKSTARHGYPFADIGGDPC